jgi:hypothetical protein
MTDPVLSDAKGWNRRFSEDTPPGKACGESRKDAAIFWIGAECCNDGTVAS